MNKIHLIYITIIIVLVALLYRSFCRSDENVVSVEHVTDTLIVYEKDTIVEYIPKYIEKTIVDTLYLPASKQPFIPLLIEQKHYGKRNEYDVWISGYQSKMDSIKVYPTTIYKNITNTTTERVVVSKWDLYTYIGFKRLSNDYKPSVGLMAKSPKKWLYGVELGMDNNSDIYWGLILGYKIK